LTFEFINDILLSVTVTYYKKECKGMVTIKDVAKKAKVSVMTVSRAINNHPDIKQETKLRVLKIAKEMGYRPNFFARNIKRENTGNIGFIVSEQYYTNSEPFYSKVFKGASLKSQFYKFDIYLSVLNTESIEDIPNFIKERKVDCVICVGPFNNRLLEYLIKENLPIILVDHYFENEKIYMVNIDNVYGTYTSTKLLISLGHRNIGYIGGLKNYHYSSEERFTGYNKALIETGISIKENLIKINEAPTILENGYELTKQLIEKKNNITAIVYHNDAMAIGGLKALTEKGYKVPDDISIVGFDDIPLASTIHPS